ncbi:hypothetical protein [Zhihengliuella halotolerans]|uniref:hypothetical protein n=1 Tax=Zhihengliuella halotolerans TaxID=370736 RepID=UPI000C80B55E|nr:hypothetical protein [Zhihengliuella halotolerans]
MASFRYAIAVVYPARPTPDYGMQEGIAYAGAVPILVVLVVAGVLGDRRPEQRGRIVVRGARVMILLGLLASIAAHTLPAP